MSDTSSCQKTLQVADNANGRTCSSGRGSHILLTQTALKRANSFSDAERSVDKSSSARKTYNPLEILSLKLPKVQLVGISVPEKHFLLVCFLKSEHSLFC